MTQNQIAYQAHLETKRANEARETETHRSNIANEKENERYHSASLAETNRANVARETETNRSNLANEMLKATDIRVRSEDSRYATDVGYQGRVDSAYINQWGVSPTDVSSLASSIGRGVKTLTPGAKGVANAAFDAANYMAIKVATAPVRAVVDATKWVQKTTNRIVAPQSKSTNTSNSAGSRSQTQRNSKIGGQQNVKKKKFIQQKY